MWLHLDSGRMNLVSVCCVSSSEGAKCFCDGGEEESDPRHLQGFREKKEKLKCTRALGLQSHLPACRILDCRIRGLLSHQYGTGC